MSATRTFDRRASGSTPQAVRRSTTTTRSPVRSSRACRAGRAPRTRTRGRGGRPRRSPAGRRRRPAERQRIFLKAADILESRRDEVVSLLARETGCKLRLRHVPDALRAGAVPAGGGARLRAGRRGDPVRPSRDARDGDAPAGRRRRRDRAVERRADPVGALDRGAARARQHGRAEAVGVVAAGRRPALGRDLRGGGPAGGRAEHRHARARRRRRRSATSSSRIRRCAASTSPARRRPGAGSPRRPAGT